MEDLLSVVIPVYNVEEYLPVCLEHILGQTESNMEIILVDDCSTDHSFSICREYEKRDSRIVVVHHDKNQGLSAARNSGVQIARGRYLTFLDSDDYIHPETYEYMLSTLKEYEADIVMGGIKYVFSSEEAESEFSKEKQCFDGREACARLYQTKDSYLHSIVAWNKIYDREKVSGDFHFPVGKLHEDEYTTYRFLYEAKKIVYLEGKMYYYRQRKNSIMGVGFSLRRLEALDALCECADFYQGKGDKELFDLATIRYLNNIMSMYSQIKKEKKVKAQLKKTFVKAYRRGKNEGIQIPSKRKALYWCFQYMRPLYYAIVWAKSESH